MYKIYNGTEWVDICNCNLNVYGSNFEWINVDPKACQVKFWTGTEWCEIICDVDCLNFLRAGECGSIPSNIQFNNVTCDNLFPSQGCDRLVAYIPIELTNSQLGFTCTFSPLTVYDGLDVVDVCNQTVVGGLGMLGGGAGANQVIPGVYTYTKKVFYNFVTNQFEVLTGFPDFQMEFKYPNNCINDWDTNLTVGTTTGYENLAAQGNPLPSVNEMYLPRIKDIVDNDVCTLPGNNTSDVNFVFNRPAAPPGGYPPEETFIIRAFGHPIIAGTVFSINNLTCF